MEIKMKNYDKRIESLSNVLTITGIIAETAMIIFAGFLILYPVNKANAHDMPEMKQNDPGAKKDIPFSFTITKNSNKYTEILKPPRTITMRSGLVMLEPGQEVGSHSTEKNEEMLVILEGQGEVEFEGKTRLKITGGQVAYVPPQTKHNVHNTGSAPLKYIFIVSKAIN
jgi:mannose-6-phosphate isomerase-like protein (cupin superfamily)